MAQDLTKISKFLALVLRHEPSAAGITLDPHGWADVDALIRGTNAHTKHRLDRDLLAQIVREDNKQRYQFSEDGTKIRAVQGHSVPVEVEMETLPPPPVLWHGTATRFLDSILAEGLKPMSRLYVHLSKDVPTAVTVGRRHGRPAVLRVDSERMAQDGFVFHRAANGVWLTETVPPQYLTVWQDET